ncbi:type II toxin-antitoxin system YoeB family toxin [Streptomyces sp. NPDC054804]
MLAQINKRVEDVKRDPFTGMGAPEHLPAGGAEPQLLWMRRASATSSAGSAGPAHA